MMRHDVLIIGGGHGGAQAAIALRQLGFAGSIGLVGDEPHFPYERPPLSKDYMSGNKSFERILIRPEVFWAEREIDMMLGRRVIAVDAGRHVVDLTDGERIGYDKLIWATGGSPRPLSCAGAQATGIHSIRTRADVDTLMAHLSEVRNVTIIGGGYIGLEAAAVLTKLGKAVTLLEALDRVLKRVAGEALSHFYEEEHRAHGVDLRLNAAVDHIAAVDGRAVAVVMADGERIETDLVIVGIGIIPAVGPLLAAGAEGQNGVDVDTWCRTSLPDIYAIGDCAAHNSRFANGARIRIESVQNANDQAKTAAHHIVGDPRDYDAIPWFWSNQYDLKLQTVGLSTGHDQAILRGDPTSRSFSIVYLKDHQIIALDCVNMAKDYVQGRSRILSGIVADQEKIANAAFPLKE